METATLLVGLFFCHFLADFTWLYTPSMESAKNSGNATLPIFYHAIIHTFVMAVFLTGSDLPLIAIGNMLALQLLTHFLIDLCESRINARFPSLRCQCNRLNWLVIGAVQCAHLIVIWLMWLSATAY